jgi:hypothetical protein
MKLFYNNEPFPEEERENPWTGEKWARLIAKMQRYEINYGGHWAPPIFDPPVGGVIHGRVNAPLPPQEAPEPELANTQIYWNRALGENIAIRLNNVDWQRIETGYIPQ